VRTKLLVTAALMAAVGPAEVATAHDSLAPSGARHTWLPDEDWVAHHWSPFDERALERALGLAGRDLEAYLYNDHHTLAELATLRGIDIERLADELVAPWLPHTDPTRVASLRERAVRLLTQGHLAQHVFFHVFHNSGGSHAVARLLGMSRKRFWATRGRGLTPLAIARRRGVRGSVLKAGLVRFFRRHRDHGIHTGMTTRAAAARIFARQRAAIPCWLRSLHPVDDPGNPYGKAKLQHGDHDAGWPATPAERRANEARVERVRRALPRSCWRPPPAWSWPANGLTPP
jgi:hypothetical protein